jgi:hypothetical protein
MRPGHVIGAIAVAMVAAVTGSGVAAARASGQSGAPKLDAVHRDFDAARFPSAARVDNQDLPLIPGMQYVFRGTANRGGGIEKHRVIFTVTDLTKVVNGVRSVVVWDRDINQGELVEAEIAFNAQDDGGNVWLLGEYPEEYEDGKFLGAPSTWLAGRDRARAGVLMRADPRTATSSYHQGLAPEVEFNDKAKVQQTGRRNCVPFACFDDVVVIKEWNPLEPEDGYQLKFHAPGVGTMRVGAVDDPEQELLVLIDVRRLDTNKMAKARAAALELEARAYEISDVYRASPPLEICDTLGACTPAANT